MKTQIVILISAMLILPAIVTGKEQAKPVSIDTIQILKISPQDQRAVIKQTDGTMRIVKVGDAVGANGKIIEISAGRVVIDEISNNETERIIIRLENDKQRVERLKRTADKQPPLYSPNARNRK